ncbi:hypothetical protein GQ42DRAFT_92645 [Ramicandelaber brevisporus]|nr:hypothetical protein GQ42DRAFT_92645 [Ramicandelaber brevisporus]
MRNDHEQTDELEQQQPTLPLLYLPVELAEEISLYFEGRAAAKLLRVSRAFHSLFLPRVWVDLVTFAIVGDDEAKRHMLEKYGHFARRVDISSYITSEFDFDWLPFVKHVAYLSAYINYEITAEEAELLMESVKHLKMLRTLDLSFDEYNTGVKFDELVAAINELKYLKRITCEFGAEYGGRYTGGEWKRAAGFVDLLHPSKRSKLRFKMNLNTVLNDMDVRALAPYTVELVGRGSIVCNTYLAHEFFSIRDNDGQPLVFPQLKVLFMTSCCFKSEGYDVKSITASRFPQLQYLHFRTHSCGLLARGERNRNEHEKYNWKPDYSGYSHIIIPSQRWQYLTSLCIGIVSSSILMDIIGLHPQLQRLRIESEYSNVPKEDDPSKYNHDEFQLDTILDRLPRLEYFSIERLNSRIIVNPAATPLKHQNSICITIGRYMSMTPSAVVYIMQMPRLKNVLFYECVFVDMDETIRLLQGNAKKFQKLLERSSTGWNA